MKEVFVDTSAFYAYLDRTDHFHAASTELFLRGEREGWHLLTSNYVLHESWALIQARLGWDAVEDWLNVFVPRCEVVWIEETLHRVAAARARQARERRLSLTDCSSFEIMLSRGCREVIADDAHFFHQGFTLPQP